MYLLSGEKLAKIKEKFWQEHYPIYLESVQRGFSTPCVIEPLAKMLTDECTEAYIEAFVAAYTKACNEDYIKWRTKFAKCMPKDDVPPNDVKKQSELSLAKDIATKNDLE